MSILIRSMCLCLLLWSVQAAAQDQDAKPAPAPEQAPQAEKAQREQMRREVEEAAREIGAYSAARRDDALARARQAMRAMDERIQQKEREWSQEAQRRHAEAWAAREHHEAQVRERRERTLARYHEMEASNAAAWALAKERFIEAYRNLAEALGAQPTGSSPSQDGEDQQRDPAQDGQKHDDGKQGKP